MYVSELLAENEGASELSSRLAGIAAEGGAVLKKAFVEEKECVACGTCLVTCPRQAIHIAHGCYAVIDSVRCVGCGLCSKACPASVIEVHS